MKKKHILALFVLILAVLQVACSKENGSTDVGSYASGSRPSEHYQSVIVEVDQRSEEHTSELQSH